jgi:hypothetical protein
MTQLSYRNRGNGSSKIIGALILIALFSAYHFHFKEKWFSNRGEFHKSSFSNKNDKSLVYKEAHLLTFEEWKQIADIRAKEFYNCTKELDMDISRWYMYENCAREYNNNWVLFRDGLDYKANLTFEQTEELKDYWHKTRDDITEKVSKLMEENDRRKRPNKY